MVKRTIDADDLISYMEYAINSCHYEKTLIEDNLTVADVIRALIKDIDKMANVLYKPTNSEEIPTVEAIPKAEYEARLKEDTMIVLDYIFNNMKAEVEQTKKMYLDMNDIDWLNGCDYVLSVVDKYKKKIEKGENDNGNYNH